MAELTNVKGFAVDPSLGLIAGAGDDHWVRIWSIETNEPINELGPFPNHVHALSWWPSCIHANSPRPPALLIGHLGAMTLYSHGPS